MMFNFRRNSQIAFILVTSLSIAACGPITTEYCHKEERVLSNQELIDMAIAVAFEEDGLGDAIKTRQQLFDKYPDCCIMYVRGFSPIGSRYGEKGFAVQVSIILNGDEPGLEFRGLAPLSDERPYYEFDVRLNECGAAIGRSRQSISKLEIKLKQKSHEEIMENERARRN